MLLCFVLQPFDANFCLVEGREKQYARQNTRVLRVLLDYVSRGLTICSF